ncbi:START domain protein (macronuclear) [Tetrahymena thermophila SB210]|uniref:START domain protein n=1 Tax=Tetrahymena thermophila (strain SB210) TaxID=312017 RepID=Q24I55_TETTS|nr:START domain protein [Tetrahymena thermophila SB210]EAS07383.1 START domain protein [Tetrahymena thermophila SB210]|eukprot:XP_001027625.1 START domain protein [Tetrahymena thermophila SB210]
MINSTTQQIQQKIQEGLNLRDLQGWKKESNGKVFSLETIKYKDYSLKLVKIQGIINQNVEKVRKYYQEDFESQKKVRPSIDILQLVETIDNDNCVVYYKNKSMFLVSARDLLYQQHQEQLNQNLSVIVCVDIDNHPKAQTVKGCVRAKAVINIQFFEKISDNQTKMETYLLVDPKGSIPDSFVNSTVKEQLDEYERDIPIISQL